MQGVQVKDEGEYICEVETYTEPIQQKNQLSVLIPAQVEPNPQVRANFMILTKITFLNIVRGLPSEGWIFNYVGMQS